jgi:hypothetical protein
MNLVLFLTLCFIILASTVFTFQGTKYVTTNVLQYTQQ